MRLTRSLLVLATSLATAAALAGCADSGEEVTVTPDATLTTAVTPDATQTTAQGNSEEQVDDATAEPASDVDAVYGAYAEVLDNPEQYSFADLPDYDFTGEYLYALADITGDGTPELFLEAITEHNLNPVRVLSADDDGTVISSVDLLIDGAAGIGGSRTALSVSPAGDRVYQEQWRSIDPEVEVEAFRLVGNNLVPTGETWTYDQRSPAAELVRINFHPLSDRGPLESRTPTTGGAAAGGNVAEPAAVGG